MQLLAQIKQDTIKAMKEKNQLILSALRLLRSDIENEKIAKRRELSDEELHVLISKRIKKYHEEMMYYRDDNEDQIKDSLHIMAFLKNYLPTQLTEEEVDKLIEETINDVGSNFGLVMKHMSTKVKGRFDMKDVARMVNEQLINKGGYDSK